MTSGTARLVIGPLVQAGDLADPPSPVPMFQGQDALLVPVEVISNEGYLLVDSVEGVASNPPRPGTSTWNSFSHCGQVTAMSSGSRALMRL